MRVLALSFPLLAAIVFGAGCPKPLPDAPCQNVRDCDVGQACVDGVCTDGVAGCVVDTDCNVNANEICNPLTGTCEVDDTPADGCLNTSECPLNQFCNTSTGLCADLAPGFCRNSTQCSEPTPICSAASENVPGRCVDCLVDEDCDPGQECVNPGVCSGNSITCPPNSTAGANGTCFCNPGFDDDGQGGCVPEQAGEGEGEGEGEPGEGEGEGGPVEGPPCDPANLGSLLCVLSGGPYNNCSDAGVCECNEGQLFFSCLLDPDAIDIDPTVCDCVRAPPSGEGEGEGEGEGGGEGEGEGEAPGLNEPCVSGGQTIDCAPLSGFVTDCVFVSDANDVPTQGGCKVLCETNLDCPGDLVCQTQVFGDGTGFCTDMRFPPGANGETACEGDFFDPDITFLFSDALCAIPGNPDGALDRCIGGQCTEVCDFASNTGPVLDCFSGTCGPLEDLGEEEDMATCG